MQVEKLAWSSLNANWARIIIYGKISRILIWDSEEASVQIFSLDESHWDYLIGCNHQIATFVKGLCRCTISLHLDLWCWLNGYEENVFDKNYQWIFTFSLFSVYGGDWKNLEPYQSLAMLCYNTLCNDPVVLKNIFKKWTGY